MGVLAWAEACSSSSFEEASRIREEDASSEEKPAAAENQGEDDKAAALDGFRKAKIEECQACLDKAANWEAFVLDARCGMRVQTGMETLRWYRRRMGWD